MTSVKTRIKKLIYDSFPEKFRHFLAQEIISSHSYFKYLNTSFSQEGEDIILSQIFYGVVDGFYIDIGAHHPIQYSNTYRFYLHGWRGINIDAMPNSMEAFNKIRPNDINVEAAISNKTGALTYHIFEATGINTLSKEHADEMMKEGYKLNTVIEIKPVKMYDILEAHIPKGQKINFLSLDVEGFELDVLMSNDWAKYRPAIILVESLRLANKELLNELLEQHKYELIAQTVNNLYFKDASKN